MRKSWQALCDRVDLMTMRERVLVFSAFMSAIAGLVFTLLLDPELTKSKARARDLAQRNAEMRSLEQQMFVIAQARKTDPDKANRERLARLREEIVATNARIATEEKKFTPADRMRGVVNEMLAKNRRVQLVELKTLPVASSTESRTPAPQAAAKPAPGKPAPAASDRVVYRHGVEVTVTGTYLDLLAYLSDLEKLPSHLYWKTLELDAQYPAAKVKFTIYTLSLDKGWMNV